MPQVHFQSFGIVTENEALYGPDYRSSSRRHGGAVYVYRCSALENAMRQYDRIAEAILTLDRFPERFGCFHTEPEYSMGIRRMVVDNFLVCYVIEADVVTVTNVLYGASDVRQRLKNRGEG